MTNRIVQPVGRRVTASRTMKASVIASTAAVVGVVMTMSEAPKYPDARPEMQDKYREKWGIFMTQIPEAEVEKAKREMRERLVVCDEVQTPHSYAVCSCTQGHKNPRRILKQCLSMVCRCGAKIEIETYGWGPAEHSDPWLCPECRKRYMELCERQIDESSR